MNRVTTTSTCGRCGAQEVRVGILNGPPVGWVGLNLEREVTVGGRPDKSFVLFCDAICPPCQEMVLEALKPPVRDDRYSWLDKSAEMAEAKDA